MYLRILGFCLCIGCLTVNAQASQKIICTLLADGSANIEIDSTIHQNYGVSYPLTYQFSIPSGSYGLTAWKRISVDDPWVEIEMMQSDSFYNGVEACRQDTTENMVYISASFGSDTDSLYLKLDNHDGPIPLLEYMGIPPYYDNRNAAVTCSADDWASWFDSYFPYAVEVFREHNLWLSVGIISEGCNNTTWQHIQEQLDLGMVEAASHSRNHPHAPYGDADYEVSGSRNDIIDNLDLPPSFRKGDQEYVYTWIAPYGEYDDEIDSLVASNQYLVSRMYTSGDYTFSDWVPGQSFYGSVGMSREVGPFWEGTVDIEDLNGSFDTAYQMNGIYHLMCHPHVLSQENIWSTDYIWDHLEYVSNHKDIWYASVGQLYLYHLLQDENSFNPVNLSEELPSVPEFSLSQNFPNPFNPATTINFTLERSADVDLVIYDLQGRLIRTLISSDLTEGSHQIVWSGNNQQGNPIDTGLYFCHLAIGDHTKTIKMLFLK